MSNSKCNCEAKLLDLEEEIKALREEFEAAEAYIMELINNLNYSVESCYGFTDDLY